MIRARMFRTGSVAGLVAVGALALSACSGQAVGQTGASGQSEPAAETIVAAADSSLLPYNFTESDQKTWTGINIDLAKALEKPLGAKIEFEQAGFDTIIPGLTSKRYDLAMTGMFDTKEREKSVDFVDYLGAKNDFLMKKSTRDVASFEDLCGLTIGVPTGAQEVQLAADASTKCESSGRQKITVNEYKDLSSATLALTSGRIDVAPNDSATNAYILKANASTLKTSGSYLEGGYFAAAFPKSSDLTERFQKAFQTIIDDGSYAAVLEKWGIADRAVDTAGINQATF